MRVLVVGNNMYGIVNLLMGLAQALDRSGHEVRVLAGASLQEHIACYGLRTESLPFPDLPYPLHTATVSLSALHSSVALLRTISHEAGGDTPDVVVTSHDGIPGVLAAQVLDIPLVVVSPFENNARFLEAFWSVNSFNAFREAITEATIRRMSEDYAAVSRELRDHHGVKLPKTLLDCALCRVTEYPHRQRLDLVANTEGFLGPYWSGMRGHRCVGPMIRQEVLGRVRPTAGVSARRASIVYVSLGTVYSNNQHFFDMCANALGGLNADVVYSLGNARLDTSHAPSNFSVRPFVAQTVLLQEASACVTHGGINTVQESVSTRVPCVVCPQGYDQFITAERIEASRAGVTLHPTVLSVESLRASVEHVLHDMEIKSSVARLADDFELAGGTGHATGLIEDFVAGVQ